MTQHQHTNALVTGLNQQSLAQLPSHVDTPTYDRSAVKAGIVHIGVGGFHPDGTIDNKVIGSMIDFLFAPEDKQAVINKLAHSDTKIVSLTITEGGYNFNPATGEFDYSNPDIINDINNPNYPITAFGYITAALKLRKEQGLGAFTVQSCDNIQHNGNVTRKMQGILYLVY